jgi:HPt (histidine-containing phosphotransfer) domain-containing protein
MAGKIDLEMEIAARLLEVVQEMTQQFQAVVKKLSSLQADVQALMPASKIQTLQPQPEPPKAPAISQNAAGNLNGKYDDALVQEFMRQIPIRLNECERGLDWGDWGSIILHARDLSGDSAILGFKHLALLARSLERAAISGEQGECRRVIAEIKQSSSVVGKK